MRAHQAQWGFKRADKKGGQQMNKKKKKKKEKGIVVVQKVIYISRSIYIRATDSVVSSKIQPIREERGQGKEKEKIKGKKAKDTNVYGNWCRLGLPERPLRTARVQEYVKEKKRKKVV